MSLQESMLENLAKHVDFEKLAHELIAKLDSKQIMAKLSEEAQKRMAALEAVDGGKGKEEMIAAIGKVTEGAHEVVRLLEAEEAEKAKEEHK